MVPFEEFAEMVERGCFSSWRSAIGKDNEALISEVQSVLFTKEDKGSRWEFSFALRRYGRWAQSKRSMEPMQYDLLDPPPAGEYDPRRSQSPQNRASELSLEMLMEAVGRL